MTVRLCLLKLETVKQEGPRRIEAATGESRRGCFGSAETLQEEKEPRWGCCRLTAESEKRASWVSSLVGPFRI